MTTSPVDYWNPITGYFEPKTAEQYAQYDQISKGLPPAVSNDTPSGYVDPFAYQGYYGAQGFIPGKDNGDWVWHGDTPTWAMNFNSGFTPEPTQDPSEMDILRLPSENPQEPKQLSQDEQIAKDMQDYLSNYYKGGGYWTSEKDLNTNIEYSPQGGYRQWSDNPTMAGKIMSGVTMAALGAMTGGAAYAAAPAAVAAAAGGAGAALPNAMRGGLNTGDWGQAATGIGLGALGGAAGGYFGNSPLAKGLIGTGVSAAGKALSGQDINTKDLLSNLVSNIGSSYIGNYVGDATGGGMLGDIAKGVSGGLSKEAIKSLLLGKTPEQQKVILALLGSTSNGILKNIG
jgi:hypothetical protein